MVAGQLIGHEQQKGQEEKVEQQPVPAPRQLSLCVVAAGGLLRLFFLALEVR